MPYSDHSLIRKQHLTFATITIFGIAALLLGLALIIFAHYHERAYVFLGLVLRSSLPLSFLLANPVNRTHLLWL